MGASNRGLPQEVGAPSAPRVSPRLSSIRFRGALLATIGAAAAVLAGAGDLMGKARRTATRGVNVSISALFSPVWAGALRATAAYLQCHRTSDQGPQMVWPICDSLSQWCICIGAFAALSTLPHIARSSRSLVSDCHLQAELCHQLFHHVVALDVEAQRAVLVQRRALQVDDHHLALWPAVGLAREHVLIAALVAVVLVPFRLVVALVLVGPLPAQCQQLQRPCATQESQHDFQLGKQLGWAHGAAASRRVVTRGRLAAVAAGPAASTHRHVADRLDTQRCTEGNRHRRLACPALRTSHVLLRQRVVPVQHVVAQRAATRVTHATGGLQSHPAHVIRAVKLSLALGADLETHVAVELRELLERRVRSAVQPVDVLRRDVVDVAGLHQRRERVVGEAGLDSAKGACQARCGAPTACRALQLAAFLLLLGPDAVRPSEIGQSSGGGDARSCAAPYSALVLAEQGRQPGHLAAHSLRRLARLLQPTHAVVDVLPQPRRVARDIVLWAVLPSGRRRRRCGSTALRAGLRRHGPLALLPSSRRWRLRRRPCVSSSGVGASGRALLEAAVDVALPPVLVQRLERRAADRARLDTSGRGALGGAARHKLPAARAPAAEEEAGMMAARTERWQN